MTEWNQTDTISMTAKRCKAERIGLSYHQLCTLCKQGRIKNIPMGRSRLIYWPNLIAFLENGAEGGLGPVSDGSINPISEKLPGRGDD